MAEIVIIADSSPLVGLARLGRLGLLKQMAEQIMVPPAVWRETTGRADKPGALEIARCEWIVVAPVDEGQVSEFLSDVDRGEAEAIALALSRPEGLLLADDQKARRLAESRNLRVKGTVGLLVEAWRRGLLSKLGPELKALRANGLFIHPDLIGAALKETGELPK